MLSKAYTLAPPLEVERHQYHKTQPAPGSEEFLCQFFQIYTFIMVDKKKKKKALRDLVPLKN